MKTLSIIGANYAGNLCVNLLFSDDTIRIVDIGNFIKKNPHPQYNKYLNEANFKKFEIKSGNIVWGKNWDLVFPIEELYKGNI